MVHNGILMETIVFSACIVFLAEQFSLKTLGLGLV